MTFEEHVARCVEDVLQAVPARARRDVYIVSVWVTEDERGLTASIGWNTSRHVRSLRPGGPRSAWGVLEWNRFEFERPDALTVCDPQDDPLGAALRPEDGFFEAVEDVVLAMHRDGRISAALGHAVALIVDGELPRAFAE